MCAINGFNFADKDLIEKMNLATRHRGPDGSGFFLSEKVSLGHNRLSIIDLSETAAQPMKNEGGTLAVVFNGEIYNFKELKKEIGRDYVFRTQSDTEVILACYEKWGNDCVKKFDGMFAFAVWNSKKEELFLARDRIGIKPLYYFWDGKRFIFSSEIKAILEHDIPRVLSRESFNHYIKTLYVPEPLTMFDGVFKLPPASRAVLRRESFLIESYRKPEIAICRREIKEEMHETLRKKVLDSVEKHLVSDKPLGVYLSGGIDSSVVLDCVSRLRGAIDTFSVGFDVSEEEESKKFNADFRLAKKTARFYGANHHSVLLSAADVLPYFEKAVWHLDEPISNPTVIPMMKLSEFAKQRVDVVLGGDGGDELFGGYERYRLSLLCDYYQKLPVGVRSFLDASAKLKKLNTPAGIERFSLFMFQKNDITRRVVRENFFNASITADFFDKKYFKDFGKKKEVLFGDALMLADMQSWLVDESLARSDKMSMSSGLELRVPLLGRDVVDFALTVPFARKVGFFDTKIILKEAFRGRIPGFLFREPKRGWFSPAAKWLRRREIYEMAKTVLSEDYCAETRDMFNWGEVAKILDDHRDKKEYNLTMIWAIFTFQMWAKRFNIRVL